ncbi:hypothetical protein [Streptomyces lunaelactis]|uniref:hypothetical protein n=1 Tax=Streptomyces lunaelactis TaxID=1535768 RepID=UPI00158451CD|nr:hypothetical protein [Streptomyces lunaelactis]NUK00947.1 hypothetical protein [Streptomyces lunaelactis]
MTRSAVECLNECRSNLGPAPRSFDFLDKRRYARIPRPEWIAAAEPLQEILRQQNTLLREGRLVWASLVQANELLFRPGDHDHPSTVIYSPDTAAFDDDPDRLRGIARALYALKGTGQEDAELAAFSRTLASEMEYEMRMRVPQSLAGDAEVYCTDIIVSRRHLPDGVLRSPLFPLIIHPEKTAMTMMLPSRYWPNELIEAERPPA